jgi:hypothetical protein
MGPPVYTLRGAGPCLVLLCDLGMAAPGLSSRSHAAAGEYSPARSSAYHKGKGLRPNPCPAAPPWRARKRDFAFFPHRPDGRKKQQAKYGPAT